MLLHSRRKSDWKLRWLLGVGLGLVAVMAELRSVGGGSAVGSSFDFPGGVELDANLRRGDNLESENIGQVGTDSTYMDLSGRSGWVLSDQWEFPLVGQNLRDEHQPVFGVPNANRVEI